MFASPSKQEGCTPSPRDPSDLFRRHSALALILVSAMRLAALVLCAVPALAALPAPEAHFGHPMGADRKLVGWDGVVSYFRALDEASEAVSVRDLGPTTEGRPLIVAVIADPATVADLDRYRDIVQRLADPRTTDPDAAAALALQGKPVVMITCSIHSTEAASTMTAVQFVYDLLSNDTPRHRAILENTILLLVPSLNPDGIDKVKDWYERWLGSPHEGAPMVELYHKYAGHDNNRDWYIFSQRETRLVVEKLHNAWRPQIVYDVHEMRANGARIFVPPWVDPIDPNIDPLIVQQVNAFGTAIAVDLTAKGRKGVLINGIYDYFSPARHYQSYHGALRLLSESATVRIATPVTVMPGKLLQQGRNYSARDRSWNFLDPWPGGEWRLSDIVRDQLIAFESVLYSAALRRSDLLGNFYTINQRVIERGLGRSFVVPREQHDPSAAARLLQTLQFGDVEIERALSGDSASSGPVKEGDYIIPLAQPYGAFANTLLETQDYPDLRVYPGGPPQRPYDATAHTLPLLMGVSAYELRGEIGVETEPVSEVPVPPGSAADSAELMLSPNLGSTWIAFNRLLAQGVQVHRRESDGAFLMHATEGSGAVFWPISFDLGVQFEASQTIATDHPPVQVPRIGLYRGHVPSMDEGWTRWLLDRYEFPYSSVGNEAILNDLGENLDVLILPDIRPEVLEQGYQHEYGGGDSVVPAAYRNGLGDDGAAAIRAFVESGGTLLAFNRAASYAISRLDLPVEDAVEGLGRERFYGPGTLVNVEADLSHPLCYGMQAWSSAWYESGPVFRVQRRDLARVRQPLRYPESDVLASGWLLGQGHMANRAAVVDVSVGSGRVLLFGIRPQYRAQSNATFKMVFNGLFL